jgi:malate dehydrogenase (oxaloacetate-decarboxylating)
MSTSPDLALAVKGPLDCALRGRALLNSNIFNKGSAFTRAEREEFGLLGMLPNAVHSLAEQCKCAHGQYSEQPTNLAKNSFLSSLKDQNVVLFYKLLEQNIKEMLGIIYTPTEGEVIQKYSRLFRRPDGEFTRRSVGNKRVADSKQQGAF